MMAQAFSVVYFIVNHGKGDDVHAALRRRYVHGSTVEPAVGTVAGSWLQFFGLDEVRKDIVFFVEKQDVALRCLREVAAEFQLHKRNRGIAYAVPVMGVYGVRDWQNDEVAEREVESMWQVIYTIVNKGDAKGVVDAANRAGARGATICRGRGSVSSTGQRLFDFPIEPEKEVVIVLAPKDKTGDIVASIHEEMQIEEPGKGIIFVLNVEEAYGLVENT